MYAQILGSQKAGNGGKLNIKPLTERRLRKVAAKYVFPHVQEVLSLIPLDAGTSVLVSGQPELKLIFLGIQIKSAMYQTGKGNFIKRDMERVSFGRRYDVYTPGHWTREQVGEVFSGCKFEEFGVSSLQATELAVHDKKEGKWYTTWFSLGLNKDEEIKGGRAVAQQGTIPIPEPPQNLKPTLRCPEPPMIPPSHESLDAHYLTGNETLAVPMSLDDKRNIVMPDGRLCSFESFTNPDETKLISVTGGGTLVLMPGELPMAMTTEGLQLYESLFLEPGKAKVIRIPGEHPIVLRYSLPAYSMQPDGKLVLHESYYTKEEQKERKKIDGSVSGLGKKTERSIGLSNALEQTKEVLKKDIHLTAISEGQIVLPGEQTVHMNSKEITVLQKNGKVTLTYGAQKHRKIFEVDQTTLGSGHPIQEDHAAVFHAFPLEGDGSPYIVVASILTPSRKLHSTFVFLAG